MSATIRIDDRGIATLEISDGDGDYQSYTIVAAPRGLSEWACTLTRLDTQDSYRVSHEGGTYWKCTCPAWKYRKSASAACKHANACRDLYRFITALIPPPKEPTHDDSTSDARVCAGRSRANQNNDLPWCD